MSRTYRKKQVHNYTDYWPMRNYDAVTVDNPHPPPYDPKSKEGRRYIAKFHADDTCNYKEPGPSWYRHMFVERPQRREAKRQLQRYMRDEEFVVILEAKMPLLYWT